MKEKGGMAERAAASNWQVSPKLATTFKRACQKEFQFLEDQFGFRLTTLEDQQVRYDNPTSGVFVRVYYAPFRLEFNLEIGREGFPVRFDILEVLRFSDRPKPESPPPGDIQHLLLTADGIRNYVGWCAEVARHHAGGVLRWEPEVIERLFSYHFDPTGRRTWTLAGYREAMRESAAIAWDRGTFQLVVSALEAVGPDLTDQERERLRIARQKLAQP